MIRPAPAAWPTPAFRPLAFRSPSAVAVAWAVAVAAGLAALVRQYLFANSYWYDEAFLVGAVRDRGYADLLGPQPYNLVNPPLSLWACRLLFTLFGAGELALRMPSFLCGVAALALMVPLGRAVLGPRLGLLAFALFAASRALPLHASETRPYTADLMVAELVLLCAAVIVKGDRPAPRWALVGLGVAAVVGPWLSFPSAFSLGGASLALAWHLGRNGSRRGWGLWVAFNGLVALSGLALWWFSARHMYYPGLDAHWGPTGWGGFPEWRPVKVVRWLVSRPYEIGNYGTREMGIPLALFAAVGVVSLARRSGPLAALVVGPFALAVGAALLGKYPLAHRTAVFVLPALWLFAACGAGALAGTGPKRFARIAVTAALLLAWDGYHLAATLAKPDARTDYRGAYDYLHAHRRPGDLAWVQVDVVYEVYHGKVEWVIPDGEFARAEREVGRRRVWAVMGADRRDLRGRLEAAGGRVASEHVAGGLAVVLFEPAGGR